MWVDVRLPEQYPRLSERKRVQAVASWLPPSRRRLFKGAPVAIQVQLCDLSVGGALITSQANPNIEVGHRIKFRYKGYDGIVEVRSIRPAGKTTSFYGLSFFHLSDELRLEVLELLEQAD